MEFAIVDSEGVVGVERTEAAALTEAKRAGYAAELDESLRSSGGFQENRVLGPDIAWEQCGELRIDARAVNALSLEAAHAALQGYFPLRKGQPVKAYQTPQGMVEYLLGQNEKTAKGDPRAYISVVGLSLLPHRSWEQMTGKDFGFESNTCVGSSPECREACLVYSGRNETDIYNVLVKQGRMNALYGNPNAFGRILKEVCIRHARAGKRAGFLPLVRLNVFSDLPWERIYPELFKEVDVQFYDYTKVPGRSHVNYDLTFSFSGRNARHTAQELASGKRAAVVFLTEKHKLPRQLAFYGTRYDVIDGDVSDARILDPPGVIVGLSYKLPKARAGQRKRSSKHTAFVVPVTEMDGQLISPIVPRAQPGVAEADAADDTLPAGDSVFGDDNLRHLPLVG